VRRESPEFTGRVIAALYPSPEPMTLPGRTLIGAELGAHLGVTDFDGSVPGLLLRYPGCSTGTARQPAVTVHHQKRVMTGEDTAPASPSSVRPLCARRFWVNRRSVTQHT
jgi:hypothetical protein